MATVEMTKTQASLAEKFRPHFSVLNKPAKAAWSDITKAIKFVSKHDLGAVEIEVVDGSPDLKFNPSGEAGDIVLAMHGKNKISVLKKTPAEKVAKKVAKLDKKAAKVSEGVRVKAKKAVKKVAKSDKKSKKK